MDADFVHTRTMPVKMVIEARVTTNTESRKIPTKMPFSTAADGRAQENREYHCQPAGNGRVLQKGPEEDAAEGRDRPQGEVEAAADQHERHAHGRQPEDRDGGQDVLDVERRAKGGQPDREEGDEHDHDHEHGPVRTRRGPDSLRAYS